MVMLTLSQAARRVGKSKSTLNRSIKAGKLSAGRNADGSFAIDQAELARAYPDAVHVDAERLGGSRHEAVGTAPDLQNVDALQRALADAEQRAAIAEAVADERARALDAAERNIADLRRLLPAPSGSGSVRPWWRFWR